MADVSLDQLLSAFDEVYRRLGELPEDAHEERQALHDLRRQLQTLAGEFRDQARTRDQIQRELDDLNRVRDEIREGRLSVGHIGTARSGGIEIKFVNEFNRILEAWSGLDDIEAKIRELKAELAAVEDS